MNYNGIIESVLIIIAAFIGAKLVSDMINNWRIKVILYWTTLAVCVVIYILSRVTSSHAATVIINNPPTDFPGWTHLTCGSGPDQGIAAASTDSSTACNGGFISNNPELNWDISSDATSFSYISAIPLNQSEFYPATDVFIRNEAITLTAVPFILTDLSNPTHSRIWATLVATTPDIGVTAADIMVAISAYGFYEAPGLITGLTGASAIMMLIKAQIDAGYYGHKDPSFIFSGDGFTGRFDATEQDGVLFGINNLVISNGPLAIPELATWYTTLLGFFSLGIFYKCGRIS